MDLILPVRVRTCAEDVGRTGECGEGSSGDEPVRTSDGRDGEASQRYFAGRRVGLKRGASLHPVGEARDRAPGSVFRRESIRLRSLAPWVLGAVMRGKWRIIQTG